MLHVLVHTDTNDSFFFFFFNAEGFSFKSFVEGRLVPNDHPIPGPSQHALGDLH